MKTNEEIIRRIMCLLCFTDRCVLEKNIIDGIRRSLDEKEKQRQSILNWLKRRGYYDDFSSKEIEIMETPITRRCNNDIFYYYNDYECIEPLLWSIGLVEKLSDYNEFVLYDLHPPLEIGPNHSLDLIVKKCIPQPIENIKEAREIAMLWYWRCLENRNNCSKEINYYSEIINIFGKKYKNILDNYSYFNNEKGDFVVNNIPVYQLYDDEIKQLSVISERRFYSFEWIFSDEEWDCVDLVC